MRADDAVVGKRVIATGRVAGIFLAGRKGRIVHIPNDNGWDVGVEFDEPIPTGHTCGQHGRSGHCRYGFYSDFKLIHEESVEPDVSFTFEELLSALDEHS